MFLLNLMKDNELIRDLFENDENYEFYSANYRDYGHWWMVEIDRADTTTAAKTTEEVIKALKPFVVVDNNLLEEFEECINCYRKEQLDALYNGEDAEYRAQNPDAAQMYREQREQEIENDLIAVGWHYLCEKFSLDYYTGEDQANYDSHKECIDALMWPYE